MEFYLRCLFVVIVFLTTYYQEVNAACYVDENGASCCTTGTTCNEFGCVSGHLVVYLGMNELQDIIRFFHNLFLRSQISAAMSQG